MYVMSQDVGFILSRVSVTSTRVWIGQSEEFCLLGSNAT
jgi:hypothetical protein